MNWDWASSLDQFWRSPNFPMWLTLATAGFFALIVLIMVLQNTFPKLSDTPGEVRWVGPELGEHTDQVLTDILGLSSADIASLRDLGVV